MRSARRSEDWQRGEPEQNNYLVGVLIAGFRNSHGGSGVLVNPKATVRSPRFQFKLRQDRLMPGVPLILVQIQSSWFPLYDRHPQTYVPNIFFAKSSDYVKATQSIFRSSEQPSSVWLPVKP